MKVLGHFTLQDVKKIVISKIEKEDFGDNEMFDNRGIEIELEEGKIMISMNGRDLRLESEKEKEDGK